MQDSAIHMTYDELMSRLERRTSENCLGTRPYQTCWCQACADLRANLRAFGLDGSNWRVRWYLRDVVAIPGTRYDKDPEFQKALR